MRIYAFEVRLDEIAYFEKLSEKFGVEITCVSEGLSLEHVKDCKGYDAITTLGMGKVDEAILTELATFGVKYLSTRSIGYNHINLIAAKRLGIRVCNASYAPESVGDFTIMLMLIALRKYKPAVYRQNVNDYSLDGLMGRTMESLTIGVVGTGKIGETVVRELSGFGCEILAYNRSQNDEVKKYATYVTLEELYRRSDMISFHVPLCKETVEMVNAETLQKMKDGVILVNTARGELMDVNALIEGIESKKIGALAMDVFEDEHEIYHESHINDIIANRNMAYLRQFPNVILTQHMAFYTESAVEEMVYYGVSGLIQMFRNEECENEL